MKFFVILAPWTQAQHEMEADGASFTIDGDKPVSQIHPTTPWNLIIVKDAGPWACGSFAFETLWNGKGASIYLYCFAKNPRAGKSRKKLPY